MNAVGTELSQGATFLEGYPRFSFEDEDNGGSSGEYGGGWGSRRQSRKIERPQPQVSMSLDRIKSLLAPADAISKDKQPETPKEYFDKPSAALEQLEEGVAVIHPSFGNGVVQSVIGSGSSASVMIKFDAFEEPKKVVYRFAKLVLG